MLARYNPHMRQSREPMEVLPVRAPSPPVDVLPAPLPLTDVLPAHAPMPPAEVTPLVKPVRQVEPVATVLPAPLPRRSIAGTFPGERRSSILDELVGAWRLIEAVLEFIIGAVVLFVALPVLAALPILQ